MTDDLLFSTLEMSPEVSPKSDFSSNSKTGNNAQPSDFKRIFSEQVSLRDNVAKIPLAKQSEDISSSSGDLDDNQALTTAENGSLEEEIDSDIGKILPTLTVHDRALEIGRVILTTARPLVNDSSLSEFVRRQGQTDQATGLEMAGTGKRPELDSTSKQSEIAMSGQSNGVGLEAKIVNPEQLSMGPGQFFGRGGPTRNISELPTAHLITQNAQLGINRSNSDRMGEPRLNPVRGFSRVGTEFQIGVGKTNEEQSLDKTIGQKGKTVDGLEKSIKPTRDFSDQKRIEDEENAFSKRTEFAVTDKSEVKTSEKGPRFPSVESLKALATRDLNNPLADINHQNPANESNEMLTANLAEPRGTSALVAQDLGQDVDGRPRIMPKEISNFGEMLTSKADVRDGFLRTEQYANWSQRFGEVLGQRLSLAINNGSWNVKLNLHPSSLGYIDISLDIGEKGIEGQINSNDPVARQLLQDSLPKLRATLAELYDQQESINLSMGDKEKSGSESEKPDNSLEVAIDLLAEEFALKDGQGAGINGLDVFV